MLGTWGVQAQDASAKKSDKTPEEKAEMLTNRMKKQLDLTDDQVTKVKTINLNHLTQMESINNEKLTSDERNAKRKTLKESYEKSLAEVLTTEQMTKFKEGRKKRKGKRKKPAQPSDDSDE